MSSTRLHPNETAPLHDPREDLTEQQAAYIDGLRELADFLVEHPAFINEGSPVTGLEYCLTRGEMIERAREVGGRFEKDETPGTFFHLTRYFGPHSVYVYTDRGEVCERVVTTETVTREIPDPELLAEVPTVTVTETVEHVEWKCPDSLLGPVPIGADEFGPTDVDSSGTAF